MIKLIKPLLLFLIFLPLLLNAQKKDKWELNNPPGDHYKSVNFTVNEGTWMNLDVSPDGQTIAFDMLGDIYTIPMSGGKATVLREGIAWEVQPRYSPDGKKILFTSDAGGGDNIWHMMADGSEATQMTKEDFRLLNNAEWIPNSDFIVARKHFTSTRSLGAGEIWMYHTTGGKGIQLTKRKNDQQDVNEPSVSPDGRYIYFSEDMYPGGYFQYNKDPNSQIYIIRRYDREKGKIENVISGPGGACRPQISPDGKKLAFIKRIRTTTSLHVFDLETGQEFRLFDRLSKDQQEAWAVFGVYTGFDWTPDGQNIIIWGEGKLWKVNAQNGKYTEIPFSVDVKTQVAETVRFQQPVHEDNITIKAIRQTKTSPDGKTLVFNAVGHLWKKTLPEGKPVRLTDATDLEFEPAFSPDGQSIVYVTWNDETMGAIHTLNLASGRTSKLTQNKGIYRTPQYSPDGKQIVFRKEGGNGHQGFTYTQNPGLYRMDVNGQNESLICREGEHPMFSADGNFIFYSTGGYIFGSLKKALKRVKLDGSDEVTVFNTTYATSFTPSPDNRWVAFNQLHQVYIAPMPITGKPFGLTAETKAVPVAKVSRDAGISLHWSADSKTLYWTLGEEYFDESLTNRFLYLEGAVDSLPPIDTAGIRIGLELPSDRPDGLLAFTNARLITMENDQVIENGTIIVENNKIKVIGKARSVKVPAQAKVIDCKGKTIMPGLVDVHAHLGAFRYGLSPQKHWQYFANLAYGITTTHDPSSNSEMTFSQSEMVKTGEMIGPRIYSTGTILYGADGDFKAVINSLEDAKSALRRTKAFGAFSVKSYNQPRRDQRQQVIQAARELDIMVYPEGGSFFYHNMSMVVDGHTSVEHNIPVAPLYDDVIQLWSKTKTGNTPTLIVNYGGVNGEYYWYQNSEVWDDEKLLTFTPRGILDSRARHRTMIPDEEYENGHILVSKSCTKLQNAGVNMHLGSHGQLQGLGAHWELWMLAQGGMSNMQALKAATLQGANYIGMDAEIGSLKEGKLADFIVLDKNPLDDIQNSNSVRYTIMNGRLYDAATMNEIGNYDRKRTQFYWEMDGSGNGYPFHSQSRTFMRPQCLCHQ